MKRGVLLRTFPWRKWRKATLSIIVQRPAGGKLLILFRAVPISKAFACMLVMATVIWLACLVRRAMPYIASGREVTGLPYAGPGQSPAAQTFTTTAGSRR